MGVLAVLVWLLKPLVITVVISQERTKEKRHKCGAAKTLRVLVQCVRVSSSTSSKTITRGLHNSKTLNLMRRVLAFDPILSRN